MNPISWVILVLILMAVFGALLAIVKNRGKGCSCCKKECVFKNLKKNVEKEC